MKYVRKQTIFSYCKLVYNWDECENEVMEFLNTELLTMLDEKGVVCDEYTVLFGPDFVPQDTLKGSEEGHEYPITCKFVLFNDNTGILFIGIPTREASVINEIGIRMTNKIKGE